MIAFDFMSDKCFKARLSRSSVHEETRHEDVFGSGDIAPPK
jgi:hypothetical protein